MFSKTRIPKEVIRKVSFLSEKGEKCPFRTRKPAGASAHSFQPLAAASEWVGTRRPGGSLFSSPRSGSHGSLDRGLPKNLAPSFFSLHLSSLELTSAAKSTRELSRGKKPSWLTAAKMAGRSNRWRTMCHRESFAAGEIIWGGEGGGGGLWQRASKMSPLTDGRLFVFSKRSAFEWMRFPSYKLAVSAPSR